MKRSSILLTIVVLVYVATMIAVAAPQNKISKDSLQVIEAKLGTGVQEKQITGETSLFHKGDKVFVWLKTTGVASDSILIVWKGGDKDYIAKLNIGGNPWRTWSYKTASKAGEWSVEISDGRGNVLKKLNFTVEKLN